MLHHLPKKLSQLNVLGEQNPVVDVKEKQKIQADVVINTKVQAPPTIAKKL